MHFFEDVEKVIPHEVESVESKQVASNVITHEDLENLANAFKENVAESIKANNEKLKSEMLDFLKHNKIASDMLEGEEAEEPVDNEETKEKEGEN